jgi:hypothetical protein
MGEGAVPAVEQPGRLLRWWRFHFSGVSRKEAWGYGVWLFFGALVAVPELWAAISPGTARWPTISSTVGYLEYHHVWVSLIVVGVIVVSGYSALRYRADRTGVLAKEVEGRHVGGLEGDPALPFRTPEGGRLTRSVTPVREIGAGLYFGFALLVIAGATAVGVVTTDVDDEFVVGETLYGLTALFWVVAPAVLAWPRKWAADIPFPTLIETVRSFERRLRVLALLLATGMAVLLLHLVFYPWPATIPDIQDLHNQRGGPALGPVEPAPPEPTAP